MEGFFWSLDKAIRFRQLSRSGFTQRRAHNRPFLCIISENVFESWHVQCFLPKLVKMNTNNIRWKDISVLDAAIIAGLTAVFMAVATPLIRGAILRQHTAECAQKIMRAAEAFDFYAAALGSYPPNPGNSQQADITMRGVFSVFHIDWWENQTELGGQWNWYSVGKGNCSVVISGSRISERQMVQLDALLDDGDLETGAFQRRVGRYHYIIRDHVL